MTLTVDTKAGVKQRLARAKNPPGTGSREIISPRVIITAYITVPTKRYPKMRETGPSR
jgi:hypothetical protein